jgi:A/G-specific adenine glycosylase
MLQQTRVEVVIAHYEKFVARYPNVQALADAPVEDVLFAWAGLGYYRRARQLHAAATEVVKDHKGEVPSDDARLQRLPGIGRYTAGAIRSIAFGRPAPIVDGNVARVLSRLYVLRGGPGDAAWENRLWELAEELVPTKEPSAFNQGLMELGATVCLPRAPRCVKCPLAKMCRAHARGTEESYPPVKSRKATEQLDLGAWIVRDPRGHVLMRRRGEGEHNAGFWELPTFDATPPKPVAALAPERTTLGKFKHSILERTYTVAVESAELDAPKAAPRGYSWVDSAPDGSSGWTTLTRKALALALAPAV